MTVLSEPMVVHSDQILRSTEIYEYTQVNLVEDLSVIIITVIRLQTDRAQTMFCRLMALLWIRLVQALNVAALNARNLPSQLPAVEIDHNGQVSPQLSLWRAFDRYIDVVLAPKLMPALNWVLNHAILLIVTSICMIIFLLRFPWIWYVGVLLLFLGLSRGALLFVLPHRV